MHKLFDFIQFNSFDKWAASEVELNQLTINLKRNLNNQ